MNERLKELKNYSLEWAIETLDPDKLNDYEWAVAIDEKFAELIVKECAEVIFNTQVEFNEIDAMHKIRDNVKQHFGVKE